MASRLFALAAAATATASAASFAPFSVAKSFSEHAVLQRAPASARVWGWSAPGATIAVLLNCSAAGGGDASRFNVSARAGDGLWIAALPPQRGSSTPCYMSFTDSDSGASVWYLDIVFGDVLLCGGQSNMNLDTSYIINATAEIAGAAAYARDIRLMQIPLQAFSSVPDGAQLADFLAVVSWAQVSPATVATFSAECWLTARNLFDATQRNGGGVVPVGAIESDWPGASITQLSSAAALAVCNASSAAVDARGGAAPPPPPPLGYPGPIPGPGAASSQYNTMVAPLAVGPLAVGAFIYHQGEADVHGWYDPGQPLTWDRVYASYACHLRALIAGWRATFAAAEPGAAWFGVAQLNPYAGDCLAACEFVSAVRAAQFDVARSTANVTAAVIVDGGDPTAPAGSVHSRRKQMVAERLVAGAMAVRYGNPAPVYGPVYARASDASAAGSVAAAVSFAPETAPGGLQLVYGVNGTSWCPIGQSPSSPTLENCAWFAVRAAKSGWLNASSVTVLNATAIVISAASPGGVADVALATAWGQNSYPVATLFAAASGLPATPWNASIT